MLLLKRKPYKREVARGARLLDAITSDWFELVNTDTLTMSSPNWCVIGQLAGPYGGYSSKLHSMGLAASGWTSDKKRSPLYFGFDILTSARLEDYVLLRELWRDEIRKRRAVAAK